MKKEGFLKEIFMFEAFLLREIFQFYFGKKRLRIKICIFGYKFQGEMYIMGRINNRKK